MPARAPRVPKSPSPLLDVRFKPLPMTGRVYRRAAASATSDIVDRVRCEFVEMRGFSPTVDQAARLFQINREDCDRILMELVEEGFLTRTPDGRYRLPSQQ